MEAGYFAPISRMRSNQTAGLRVAASQTTPFRKPCPTIRANSGMQLPNGAPWGNRIPEFTPETGCSFPNGPAAENASRNRRSDRDAFSRSTLCGKLHPTLRGKTGTRFPVRASKRSCGGIVPAWGFNQQKQELFHRKLWGTGWGWPSYSYRWRSRKRKARRIQGRTATCLSSLSTAVLALPSERP